MLGPGIPIGRIFGIRIYIDPSWIFIFLLVTWNLAAGALAVVHPEWGPTTIWLVAIVASLLFFGSVLAHELAHSLVARSQGVPVRRITLFMFGGVADIEREPPSPRAEFLITVVGPLTSLVIGIICLLIGTAIAGISNLSIYDPEGLLAQLNPLSTILLWLGPINIVLAVFNLVPGFPLDGGRILRSIIWAISNNLRLATRIASLIGQAIGWLMILAGVAMIFGAHIPFFGTGLVSGLWLIFIGWFLSSAASQSYRQLVIHHILEGVPVNRIMRTDIPTASPYMTIEDLVRLLLINSDERSFPVVEDGKLVGLVCIEDLKKVAREEWPIVPVSRIMTPKDKLVTIGPNDDLAKAFEQLARIDVNQLPVVVGDTLVGLLRRRDLLRWLQIHAQIAR